ncbi:restriction endonuclease subunit S [Mycoplasma sp. 1012]
MLGNLGFFYSGLNGKTKEDFGIGDYKYIDYLNIFNNTFVDLSELKKIKKDDKQNLVQKGDIFFTISSEIPEEVAMSSVLNENTEKTYLNSFCTGFRLNEKNRFSFEFLAYFFRSKNFRNKSLTLAQGISRFNISKNSLKNIVIEFPNQLKEQTKIANLFSSLEMILSLHKRKFILLENIIQSLLDKMFPSQNSIIFPLKFEKVTHAWEQEVFENLYEKSSEKNNLKFGLSHFISVASSTYKTDIKIDNLQTISNYNVFRKGDIAFEGHTNSKYPFGRFVENTVGNGIISNIFSVFRPKTKYDLEYWKYAINNNSIMLKALKNSSKSGIMMNSLDIKELNRQIIVFPSLSEQTKIANLLETIDSVLSLHKRKF